jgi:hypothetical protein
MISYLNSSIRGGVCQVNNHYSTANNKYMKNYDQNKPDSFILLFDYNNLYGWSMQQKLPIKSFRFIQTKSEKLEIFKKLINGTLDEHSEYGYIFEICAEIRPEDHDFLDSFPLMPLKRSPPNSNQKKLILDLEKKINYKIHYMNLKQIIDLNIKITSITRILEFQQSNFLAEYIQKNSLMRANATNEFEKDFFKLMNNSIYGMLFIINSMSGGRTLLFPLQKYLN